MSLDTKTPALALGSDLGLAPLVSHWVASRRFCSQHPRTPIFAGVMLLLFVGCLIGPYFTPYPPTETHTPDRLSAPSWQYLLGTDQLGRDTFSRVLSGGRLALSFGLAAAALGAITGATLGVTAGYFTGLFDLLFGRVIDAIIAFPGLFLLIAVRGAFGTGIFPLLVVVALGGLPGYYRLARAQVLQVREFEFVTAARATGASDLRVMFRYILPNSLNPLIVLSSIAAGQAVLLLSTLSFLGLGLTGGTPDWGGMFNDALNNLRVQPWLVVGPGVAVFLSVLSFYVLGDDLRDALDPHDRGRRR